MIGELAGWSKQWSYRGGHFFYNIRGIKIQGHLMEGPATGLLLSNVTKATGISPHYFLQGIMFLSLLVYASIQ